MSNKRKEPKFELSEQPKKPVLEGTHFAQTHRTLAPKYVQYYAEDGQIYNCPELVELPYSPGVRCNANSLDIAISRIGKLQGLVEGKGVERALEYVAACVESHATLHIEHIYIPLGILLRAVANGETIFPDEELNFKQVTSLVNTSRQVSNGEWQFTADSMLVLHGNLMVHDVASLPGLFRTTSAGGVGDYVPVLHKRIRPLMENLAQYVNQHNDPYLVRAAVAHLQYELIHPFTDGNGRTGRILNQHIFSKHCEYVEIPLTMTRYVYVSRQLRLQKHSYFGHLSKAFSTGVVENWVNWFLQVIVDTCDDACTVLGELSVHQELPVGLSELATKIMDTLTASAVVRLTDFKTPATEVSVAVHELVNAGLVERHQDIVVLTKVAGIVQRLIE